MLYRNKYCIIRCTEEEFDAIHSRVKASGMNQQSFLLQSALNSQIYNTDGIKALIPEIKRIGNNVNQIARHTNETDVVSLQDLQDVREELNHIWLLLNAAIHIPVSKT